MKQLFHGQFCFLDMTITEQASTPLWIILLKPAKILRHNIDIGKAQTLSFKYFR